VRFPVALPVIHPLHTDSGSVPWNQYERLSPIVAPVHPAQPSHLNAQSTVLFQEEHLLSVSSGIYVSAEIVYIATKYSQNPSCSSFQDL
jgi:hypothetical protein